MNKSRRHFVLYTVASGCGMVATSQALAQPAAVGELVNETDAVAVSLGYTSDASKIDIKKFPSYAVGQRCGVCTLFPGQPTDASAACPIFGGKRVAGSGWCTGWAKKA